MHLGMWDWTLVVAVTLQASVLAYVHSPQWKAFLLLLPFPFTIATLAVAQPVGATNVWGLALFCLFVNAVRLLHYNGRVPIVPAIAVSALGYCVLGALAARAMPTSEWFFWVSVASLTGLAGIIWATFPYRQEDGSHSELPPWIKLPAIAAVLILLVLIKNLLQGFTTTFPMLGVIAVYEARKCLWAIGRAVPGCILALLPMMVTVHLSQDQLGLGVALALGWAVSLSLLWPVSKIFVFSSQPAEPI